MTVPSRHIIIRGNVFCNAKEALILHRAEKMTKRMDIHSSTSLFS